MDPPELGRRRPGLPFARLLGIDSTGLSVRWAPDALLRMFSSLAEAADRGANRRAWLDLFRITWEDGHDSALVTGELGGRGAQTGHIRGRDRRAGVTAAVALAANLGQTPVLTNPNRVENRAVSANGYLVWDQAPSRNTRRAINNVWLRHAATTERISNPLKVNYAGGTDGTSVVFQVVGRGLPPVRPDPLRHRHQKARQAPRGGEHKQLGVVPDGVG